MRILEVDLIAFGAFTETKLDFSSNEAGMHIVYGPNEAGKSTTMRAINAAFFGFHPRSKDNFLHSEPKVGATIESFEDARISFVRRKGRKNTLINPNTNSALPESALEPFLKGLNQEIFSRVYGIDHIQLGEGGEELRQLRGLVGESLFAASLGGTGLTKVLASLEDEAADLFSKSKRKVRIKEAAAEYKEAVKQKNDATIPFTKWKQLQSDLQDRIDRKEKLVKQLRELRAQQSRLERLRNSLRPLAERRRLLAEQEEAGEVKVLPEAYSAKERSRLEGEIAQIEPQISALRAKIDGDDGYQRQIEQLEVSDAMLKNETEIQNLQTELGAHQKAMNDRKTIILPKRGSASLAAKNALRDLGIERELDNVNDLRITPDRRVAIQNLGADAKQIQSAPAELVIRRHEIENTLAQLQSELDSSGESSDLSQLQRVCNRIRKDGDLEKELAEQQTAFAHLQKKASDEMSSLNLWQGSLADLARLPVPLNETINRFDESLADRARQLEQLRARSAECDQKLGQVAMEIETLKNTDNVPTEQDLNDAREHRDQIWQQIRTSLNDVVTNEDSKNEDSKNEDSKNDVSSRNRNEVASDFELAIKLADDIADRLRREAERVEKLAQLRARHSNLEKQQDDIHDETSTCEQQQANLQIAWVQAWNPCEITEPFPPREMRDWLQKHASLRHLAADVEEAQATCDKLHQQIEKNRVAIIDCLQDTGAVKLAASSPLSDLLDNAEDLIEIELNRGRNREQLKKQSKQLQTELDSLGSKQKLAEQALDSWQTKWHEAMQQIGCPLDATPAQANERLNRISRLFECLEELAGFEVRLRGVDRDEQTFTSRVTKVVELVQSSENQIGLDNDPIRSVERLRQALHKNQTAKTRRDELLVAMAKAKEELSDSITKKKQIEARLAKLCELAGVDDSQSLPEIEEKSSAHTSRSHRIKDLETQLLEIGGGLELQAIIEDAESQNVDDLQAQSTDLSQQIEKLEQERDELSAAIRELENQTNATDAHAKSVDADERGLGILSRMHRDAARYLQLRVASSALKQQIERHRAENEDPLLAKASDIFSRITRDEFIGLRNDFENDDAVIKGLRQNQELLSVEQMSSGTRDQLYLSLRLGDLQRRLSQQEPMPFFVDDILVHSDDDRAAATLEVLVELSRLTQVVMFTHHQRIVELAESNLDRQQFEVHRLPSRIRTTTTFAPEPSIP